MRVTARGAISRLPAAGVPKKVPAAARAHRAGVLGAYIVLAPVHAKSARVLGARAAPFLPRRADSLGSPSPAAKLGPPQLGKRTAVKAYLTLIPPAATPSRKPNAVGGSARARAAKRPVPNVEKYGPAACGPLGVAGYLPKPKTSAAVLVPVILLEASLVADARDAKKSTEAGLLPQVEVASEAGDSETFSSRLAVKIKSI